MSGQEFEFVGDALGWKALFGFSFDAPLFVVLPVAFFFFFFAVIFPLHFLFGFVERKLAADLQARVGPNRTAGKGALQVLADMLKLGFKSGGRSGDSRWVFLQSAALYASFAFLPLGTAMLFVDSELGVYLPFFCLGSVFVFSLFANEGGDLENEIMTHRQAFLWISAWIPALISVSVAVVRAGSAKWSAVLASQAHGPQSWLMFSSPFGFVGFFVFLLSGLVALQLPPFHSLDRGVRQRAGGFLGLYSLNQFYALIAWCVIACGLYLGGQPVREPVDVTFFHGAFQLLSAMAKAGVIYLALRVVARALPQLRQDQMTEFCWRVLTPVAALCLVGEIIWTTTFLGGIAP